LLKFDSLKLTSIDRNHHESIFFSAQKTKLEANKARKGLKIYSYFKTSTGLARAA